VSPVKYELGFYIPEDDILHSHCRENLKSCIELEVYVGVSGPECRPKSGNKNRKQII
jgi:hypothetical protein